MNLEVKWRDARSVAKTEVSRARESFEWGGERNVAPKTAQAGKAGWRAGGWERDQYERRVGTSRPATLSPHRRIYSPVTVTCNFYWSLLEFQFHDIPPPRSNPRLTSPRKWHQSDPSQFVRHALIEFEPTTSKETRTISRVTWPGGKIGASANKQLTGAPVHNILWNLACCQMRRRNFRWLDCSPHTNANRARYPARSPRIFACGSRAGRNRWSSGFPEGLPFPPPLHSGVAPFFTPIVSQDHDVERPPSLFTALRTLAGRFLPGRLPTSARPEATLEFYGRAGGLVPFAASRAFKGRTLKSGNISRPPLPPQPLPFQGWAGGWCGDDVAGPPAEGGMVMSSHPSTRLTTSSGCHRT
ncbi:hypothetical protein PR048_022507 [Dryococelus australis]|uniref:Uncharacterized protein n=1 Tax=Dryococelus australis TaxID=614101 RepID=A0ABQ9H1A0_9NEOP|nr:hypothetical protein PR048_022507 [Dryococelus australis]